MGFHAGLRGKKLWVERRFSFKVALRNSQAINRAKITQRGFF